MVIKRLWNFFTQEELENINEIERFANYQYFEPGALDGGIANHQSANIPLESKEASRLNFIFSKLEGSWRPTQMYFNRCNFGNEMQLHVDQNSFEGNDICRTLIVFIHPYWDANWHGENVIYNFEESQDPISTASPIPNSAIFSDSKLYHGMVPISKTCPMNRTIFVAQTKKDYE